jgi:hypothetical protein
MVTEFDRLKENDAKNCKKGMPCGNSCIAQGKKCKSGMAPKAAAVADHLSDPANLEKGAESGDPFSEFDDFDFNLDGNLQPISDSPETKELIEDWKDWKSSEQSALPESLAERLNGDAPPPTEAQAEAISRYTSAYYEEINQTLRGTGDLDNNERSEYLGISKDIADGLRALPNYTQETYRGTAVPKEIADKLTVGSTYTDKAFLSTSASKEIAESFSVSKEPEITTNVLFSIQGKYGKDISKVSEEQDEKEILFSPSSKFKITSVENKDGFLYAESLEEMDFYEWNNDNRRRSYYELKRRKSVFKFRIGFL